MPKYPCPVCGDPNTFPIWIEDKPPPTCPDDPAWPRRSLYSICQRQMQKAKQAAELRRITPDAFDENGTLIPSESARAWRNYMTANPGKPLVV